MRDKTLPWRTHAVPVLAGALVLCLLAPGGCGGPQAPPPPPPGLARIEDVPFDINTPPLRVKARMGPPFPEKLPSTADEVDAVLREMGLELDATAPESALNMSVDWPVASAIGSPKDETEALEANRNQDNDTEEATESAEVAADVASEVAALRSDLARMQAMLDLVLDEFVIGLKSENNRLRAELEALQHKHHAGARESGVLQQDRASEALAQLHGGRPPETPGIVFGETAEPDGAHEPIRYAVIKEWGRDPEEAARLGTASALKGLICAVPPHATDAQLASLGRWLRQEYDAYENLNIDVFDDVAAAQRFAETNRVEGSHRVLNVSKHPATNRDVIALIRDEGTTIISPEDNP